MLGPLKYFYCTSHSAQQDFVEKSERIHWSQSQEYSERSPDQFDSVLFKGKGRTIQVRFNQSGLGKTFNMYGFNLLADKLDVQ